MANHLPEAVVSAGIIERFDNRLLVVRSSAAEAACGPWEFPHGRVQADESPEAAMRRIAQHDLGLRVEIVIGQPPLTQEVDGQSVQLRYFFCGVMSEEAPTERDGRIDWVLTKQLGDHDFAEWCKPLVAWLQEE